jgi:hypothetical protein
MPISSSVCYFLSCTSFKVSGLILRSLIHFELTLVQDKRHISSLIYCMQISTFDIPATFVEEAIFSPLYVLGTFVKNQVGIKHGCISLHMGLIFCFIALHFSFCASTMLFILQWLYSIVWGWILWYLCCCSFCWVLPCIFMVFCASIWTLELIFQFLWWISLEFWWGLH